MRCSCSARPQAAHVPGVERTDRRRYLGLSSPSTPCCSHRSIRCGRSLAICQRRRLLTPPLSTGCAHLAQVAFLCWRSLPCCARTPFRLRGVSDNASSSRLVSGFRSCWSTCRSIIRFTCSTAGRGCIAIPHHRVSLTHRRRPESNSRFSRRFALVCATTQTRSAASFLP